jgi:hypothetical protein
MNVKYARVIIRFGIHWISRDKVLMNCLYFLNKKGTELIASDFGSMASGKTASEFLPKIILSLDHYFLGLEQHYVIMLE